MNKDNLKKLEKMLEDFNYNALYDFDDMKLGIICKDFMYEAIELEHIDYEDIFTLAIWVKSCWQNEFEDLSNNEQGYIQEYARRILSENINEIEEIFIKVGIKDE